ncbi:hypothetical protein FB45DRAFT_934491 [Roridomyces roridus]|uniref:Uncharacterized protein n=1 Tax=Roridomyces roridus TaxID=1738132 RepID=A0AAD7FF96_9AGAR|nr:hypothetical protein FB45DRAFT_934491 [Roridomyces roridus]
MDTKLLSPALPQELEREIFELAAYCRPLCVPSLMRVAWRVNRWVKPYLFRIVLLLEPPSVETRALKGTASYPCPDDEPFARYLSTPASTFRDSTRDLCLRHVSDEITEYLLSSALNLENLWISPHFSGPLAEMMRSLRLRRLACDLRHMFGPKTPIDFTHPIFSRLTHLEFFDYGAGLKSEFVSGLASLPHLTHLAFNDRTFVASALAVLETCASLRVLIFLTVYRTRESVVDVATAQQLGRDGRFVHMCCFRYIKDWHMGALTGNDYWARAEIFIAKRKAGEVNALEYRIEEDESEKLL